ncbi:copper chaperone PCu(A)C [Zhongshania aliphaticivorans]|uniref:copper chaperone PCu(A)C n=1 Tax=Zhongshania aliphaticivorans TaxID=1470434 RepID=UPI0012E6A124|nr:copper chaperone PCu(A)C [Zhongshania aliphaticivorans]CAA0097306.1 Uncharacterised protein [Zhongshania aliphaticivorans]
MLVRLFWGKIVVKFRACALFICLAMPVVTQALEIKSAYVRGLPPNQRNTAAFFSVENSGTEVVELQAGSSDAAARLEIHAHQHQNGMMSMQMQPSVRIEAGQRIRFVPGGYHLMLIDLKQPLIEGDSVSFSLRTVGGEELSVTAPVISVLNEASALNDIIGKQP